MLQGIIACPEMDSGAIFVPLAADGDLLD